MQDHPGDEFLLQMLAQIGVDFEKQRELNFAFVFPSEESAAAATHFLTSNNHQTDCMKVPVPWWKRLFAKPQWFVTVTRMDNIDRGKIQQARAYFEQVAGQFGGQYDGWEANVMDDHIKSDEF